MSRFVALLRGVNVGGAKRVPMAAWRTLLEGQGYGAVRTLLNSGNAVFDSTGRSTAVHARRIQAALADGLGLDVPVIVKSAAEMATVVAENALAAGAADASRLLVAFTADAGALDALAALQARVVAPERILVGTQAMYLWCPDGILASAAASALLGKAGRSATTRNWATVLKLVELLRHDD